MNDSVALQRPDLTAPVQLFGQRRGGGALHLAIQVPDEMPEDDAERRHGRLNAVVVAPVAVYGELRWQGHTVLEPGAAFCAEADPGVAQALVVGAGCREDSLQPLEQNLRV